jgi:hypothetical protein
MIKPGGNVLDGCPGRQMSRPGPLHVALRGVIPVIVSLVGVSQASAQAPPSVRQLQGWVEGVVKWDEVVREDNVDIPRKGHCTFRIDFGADGVDYASQLSYHMEETSYSYQGTQMQIEVLDRKIPGRIRYDAKPKVVPKPGGNFDIFYDNLSYEVAPKIKIFTRWDNQWRFTEERQGADYYSVKCAPNSFVAPRLLNGGLGPVTGSTVLFKALNKQVRRPTITLKWNFETWSPGPCHPSQRAEKLGDFTWCHTPEGVPRR